MKKLSSNLKKIITILSDGHIHSGESLGQHLGITRAGVWKFIKQLSDLGIPLESTKKLGYRLLQPLILLDNKLIKNELQLRKELLKKLKLEIFSNIDSTNTYLRKYFRTKTEQIPICIAEMQTAGKARLDRTWHSPFGVNLYFSCLWRFHKDLSELAGLSLAISLAIIATLDELGLKKDLKVKWPNDILWQQQKLAGILIEVNAESHNVSQAIIGIGLNINIKNEKSKVINQPWTSLEVILGKPLDRNVVTAKLINHLFPLLEDFEKNGFTHFKNHFKKYDYLLDKNIALIQYDKIIKGKAVGINIQGNLLLEHHDSSVHAYSSGDTTISKKA